MIFGINTTCDISKLSQILKYHSWYLCQISLQIMLLLILNQDIFSTLNFTSIKCVSEPFQVLSQTEKSYFPPFHVLHNQWNPNHFLYLKPEKRYAFLKGFLFFRGCHSVTIGRNILLLIHNGKHSKSKKNINTFLYFLNEMLRF